MHEFPEEDIAFSAVEMLPAEKDLADFLFRPDTLYFARNTVSHDFPFPQGLSFVMLRIGGEIPSDKFRRGAKLILVAETAEVFSAFYDRCRDVLSVDAEMSHALMNLTKMVSKNKSLKEITAYIAQVYNTEVSIADNAYRVLAYAAPAGKSPSALIDERDRGFLDQSVSKELNRIDFLTPRLKVPERKCFIIPGSAAERFGYKQNNYCVIYVNGNAIAALSVFDNGNIDDYKLKYMEAISYVLSNYMQKREFYQLNRGAYFNHLMSIIVGNSSFDPDVMQKRLAVSGYKLKECKYIIAAEYTHTDEDMTLDSLGLYLKNVFPNSIYIVLENKVLYLMSTDKPLNREEFSDMDKFLKSAGACAGASDRFRKLSDVHTFVDEAKDALEIGRRIDSERSIFLFEDCCKFSVARSLVKSAGKSTNMYVYPPLVSLIEYDADSGSSLTETLREYLRNPKNPKAVCEKLFIHKNTLYYRLGKIKQIMGSDFEAADVQMRINLAFAILDYQKNSQSYEEIM